MNFGGACLKLSCKVLIGPFPKFVQVSLVDAVMQEEAWAAGGSGILLRTTNGGKTWTRDKAADNIAANLYSVKWVWSCWKLIYMISWVDKCKAYIFLWLFSPSLIEHFLSCLILFLWFEMHLLLSKREDREKQFGKPWTSAWNLEGLSLFLLSTKHNVENEIAYSLCIKGIIGNKEREGLYSSTLALLLLDCAPNHEH